MQSLDPEINQDFWIPDSLIFSNPDSWETIYPLLHKVAKETQINLFRTSLGYSLEGKAEIIQFVLLTRNTSFFNHYSLRNGRFLTPADAEKKNVFLSTTNTGSENQVGLLEKFGNHPIVKIHSLEEADSYLPLPGLYFVEASNQQVYQTFVDSFVKAVNKQFEQEIVYPFQAEDFIRGKGNSIPEAFGTTGADVFQSTQVIRYLIFFMTVALLIYYCFHSTKRVGIMKMHGVSNIRVWYSIIGRLIMVVFFISTGIFLVLSLGIQEANKSFIIEALRSQAILFITVLGSSLIAYFHIVRTRISDAIKNQSYTTSVFVLNTLLKTGGFLLLILMMLSYFEQYDMYKRQQNQLNHWQQSQQIEEYGIFYPVSLGRDFIGVANGEFTTQYKMTDWLYPFLNEKGALFIDASQYEQSTLALPETTGSIRSIKVNPNYLKEYPVYDHTRQLVEVSDDISDLVLLVPEKYKKKEREIILYFSELRSEIHKVTEKSFFSVPNDIKEQKVEIIWLSNNQKIFSFNPDVFPREGNEIIDPIIQVLTERNSVSFDGLGFIGGSEASALKIPLSQSDALLTMEEIAPKLKELGLDKRLRNLVSINQAISQKIEYLQRQMNGFLIIITALLIVSLFLVIQHLIILFAKYQQKFLVRRLFGFGYLRTYKEHLIFFVGKWIVLLLICLYLSSVITMNDIPAEDFQSIIRVFYIVGVLVFLELVFSSIGIIRLERKKLAQALKEGS